MNGVLVSLVFRGLATFGAVGGEGSLLSRFIRNRKVFTFLSGVVTIGTLQ